MNPPSPYSAAPSSALQQQELVCGSDTDALALAAWHSLTWLLISSCLGLLLATLLLFPQLNACLGEWTYGHWVPLHLNLNLYGWCSLPLVAWLFHIYQVNRSPGSEWSRSVLWLWSAALAVGAISWLRGQSSGKLFLDWEGYPRIVFVLAMLFLWWVLAGSFYRQRRSGKNLSRMERVVKSTGLILLLCVPFTLYWAARPSSYPPVNPATGGPTGASLLASTLGIILILLLLPYGFARVIRISHWARRGAWLWLAMEAILGWTLGRGDESHHQRSQILGLGSLLFWVPGLLAYYRTFDWPAPTRRWRNACLGWWFLLTVSGWLVFLPGVLDRFKFTDALVGHSHLAMAGFVSSMNMFVLVGLLGEQGRTLNSTWAFTLWHAGTLGSVIVLFLAGWRESQEPAFTFIPGAARQVLYSLRLVCGGMMTAAALYWWLALSSLISRKPKPAREILSLSTVAVCPPENNP